MKPLRAVIGAVVLALAACTAHHMQNAVTQEGPWKLYFKDPTLLRSVEKFEKALNHNSGRWEKEMRVKERKGEQPRPRLDHTNNQPEPSATVRPYPSSNQRSNKDSLHVTQRVVLHTQEELDKVEALIRYHDTPSK